MADVSFDLVAVETAAESLRQQRETFNQRKVHEERWFSLRLRMGYTAIVLLPAILFLSGYVLLNASEFSRTVVALSAASMFTDALGLVASVWKVVLNPDSVTKLSPVTESSLLGANKARG